MSLTTPACPPRAPRDATVLRVADDILTEDSLRDARRLLDEPGRHRLHLDLGAVRSPTAGGLGALVALHQELRQRGGHLALRNVRPCAYEVFAVTRLTEVLDVQAA